MRNTPPASRSDWATLVVRVRAASGMSGAEIARRLKVDRATIWRWETGKQRPESLALVEAFAELFRLPLEDVLAAAGMRPAGDIPELPQPIMQEPDLAKLFEILADPATPQATKDRIRRMLRDLLDLAEQIPRPPRRRRVG